MAIEDATATAYMGAAFVIVIPFIRRFARRAGGPIVVTLATRADVLARLLVCSLAGIAARHLYATPWQDKQT